MLEMFFYFLVLLLGAGLIVFKPLSQLTKVSIYWEIGFGALLIIIFLFSITKTYVTPQISDEDLAKKPCGSSSPQGACYSLEKDLCEKAWANAEASCKAEVTQLMKDRPSAIIGPAVNRCRAKKVDQFLRFNRTNTESPFCKSYFEFIEAR
ncbi:MAG: hypothetical protein IPM97_06195 [Bdellovibrionaceae bacterium]|nr:hypothetical protein [Pseudobdellovibrionaceae bacterium]